MTMKPSRMLLHSVMLTSALGCQAATLKNGDVLYFTATAGSVVAGGASPLLFDSAPVDALNGLIIGTAQPSYPDIDKSWTTTGSLFSITGNHRTTSPVKVTGPDTLDFSGWVMVVGNQDYAFGQTQSVATYTYDGTHFTLSYTWQDSDNGGNPLGNLGLRYYTLYLSGTVIPAPVPIPPTVWLFGSGLFGLLLATSGRKVTKSR